jgi:pyridoxamine 5'-phosphate oxidase-like protein
MIERRLAAVLVLEAFFRERLSLSEGHLNRTTRSLAAERILAMGIQLSNEIKALLDRPSFVHLARLMPNGSPQSVPVWVGREGELVLICTGDNSLKARNTQRDPRVALSVIDFQDPY